MAAGKRQGGARDSARRLAVPKGVAHVSFQGGGMFLPARSPYDRQMLMEFIVDRARVKEQVQVLVGDLRWMVCLRQGEGLARCSVCGDDLRGSCYSTDERGKGCCLGCAFGDQLAEGETTRALERVAVS